MKRHTRTDTSGRIAPRRKKRPVTWNFPVGSYTVLIALEADAPFGAESASWLTALGFGPDTCMVLVPTAARFWATTPHWEKIHCNMPCGTWACEDIGVALPLRRAASVFPVPVWRMAACGTRLRCARPRTGQTRRAGLGHGQQLLGAHFAHWPVGQACPRASGNGRGGCRASPTRASPPHTPRTVAPRHTPCLGPLLMEPS